MPGDAALNRRINSEAARIGIAAATSHSSLTPRAATADLARLTTSDELRTTTSCRSPSASAAAIAGARSTASPSTTIVIARGAVPRATAVAATRIESTPPESNTIGSAGVAVEHHSYSIEGFGGYCLRRDVGGVCGGAEAGTIDVECVIVCDELHWLCGLECSR